MSESYYDLLGVSSNATKEQISKAFRKKAKELHPDKNPGKEDLFKKVAHAYEVLCDEKKRQIYDTYGEEGLSGHPEGNTPFRGTEDILNMFFGGRSRSTKKRTDDLVREILIDLESLYTGTVKKFQIERKIICPGCDGIGGKKGSVQKCSNCHGRGQVAHVRQLAPGMMQQVLQQCDVCNGSGEVIQDKDRCQTCFGAKVTVEQKSIQLKIPPGARNGSKIVERKSANQYPGYETGDIIFIIKQKEHRTFTRRNDDLVFKKTILLSEALGGISYPLQTLDNRSLHIKTEPGDVISPNSYRIISKEGMPTSSNPSVFGDLYILFDVIFPDSNWTSINEIKEIVTRLPQPNPQKISVDAIISQPQPTSINSSKFDRRSSYDEDQYEEEDSHAGHSNFQSAQCNPS